MGNVQGCGGVCNDSPPQQEIAVTANDNKTVGLKGDLANMAGSGKTANASAFASPEPAPPIAVTPVPASEQPDAPTLSQETAPDVQALDVNEAGAGQLVLQLHSAELFRGFSSLGALDKMSPYAVIAFDKIEVARTKPDSGAHKKPRWEFEYVHPGALPQEISVAVWDKNNFHKDVLCGVCTLPIAADMLDFHNKDCTLQKKAKKTKEWVDTGKMIVSIRVPHVDVAEIVERDRALTEKSFGGELDAIISFASGRAPGRKITLTQTEVPVNDAGVSADDDGDEVPAPEKTEGVEAEPAAPVSGRVSKVLPALIGSWKCVATQGLEEFLLASGVGMFQRKLASKAAWPSWEFVPKDEEILFINHSAIGDLKETIPLGKEYTNKDGHGNPMTCHATWTRAGDGGTLLITRTGTISGQKSELKEERIVVGDKLEFKLTSTDKGITWGRSFVRN